MSARRGLPPLSANRRRAGSGRARAPRRAPPGEDEDADEGGCCNPPRRQPGVARGKRRAGRDKCNAPPAKGQRSKGSKFFQQKAPKPRFRDPLPMKMRALPQSFWQQPNLAPSSAPGGSVCALPPLPLPILLEKAPHGDHAGKGSAGGDAAMPAVGEAMREREEVVSAANTDLLFSLFRGVERVVAEAQRRAQALDDGASEGGGGPGGEAPRRPAPTRRGRPRKATRPKWSAAAASAGGAGGGGVRDDDPCLVSAVADDSIRPLLPSAKDVSAEAPQVLTMVTLPEVDGDVSLPTLDVQHNYSQILSKLVMKL